MKDTLKDDIGKALLVGGVYYLMNYCKKKTLNKAIGLSIIDLAGNQLAENISQSEDTDLIISTAITAAGFALYSKYINPDSKIINNAAYAAGLNLLSNVAVDVYLS